MSRSVSKTTGGTIDDFINFVGSTKTASVKVADGTTPLSEPGSIGGETKHPVKSVDDRLEKAKEGERSAENSKDVKEDQGASSVEATKVASIFSRVGRFAKKAEGEVSTPGSAEDDHISSTMKVAPTGEDPAHETNSAKAGKEDKKQGDMGGTKHPASTENDSLDGHKYAADVPLEKLASDLAVIGNNLLTAIHNAYQNNGVAPAVKTAATQTQPNRVSSAAAFTVGHELDGLLSGKFDKQAADAMVQTALTDTIKQAADDADMFISYAQSFFQKMAEGSEPPAEAPPEVGGMPPGAGGPPPGAGGPPPGAGGEDAMMSALGGGAGGPPEEGGQPPVDVHQALEMLEQLGITPEELQQALAAEGAGGGAPPGGAPGGELPPGGMPAGPPAAGGMPGMETAASVGRGKGNPNVKVAEMRQYISEIISRSRK